MSGRAEHGGVPGPSRIAGLRDVLLDQPGGGPLARIVRTPLRLLFWLSLRSGLHIRVEGPRFEGPAVVVSNHPHVIDGLVVLLADPSLRPIARWHRVPLLRGGMWIADCVVTTTGTPVRPHRGAFADALAHVRRGGRVWIAPEGGWQPELMLRYPRTGAVRIAHAAGVPIQVLGVIHEPHPGPQLASWRPWHRPRILLRWGEVLTTTGAVDVDIDRMMTAIAAATGVTWTPPTTRG
ncbi:MAG TPA: lysophospholipid acyltransferase family protein [Euzebyales bacterium]|nr:lysophospholipid acyltransferase family protein [Euzebyales bacterium]